MVKLLKKKKKEKSFKARKLYTSPKVWPSLYPRVQPYRPGGRYELTIWRRLFRSRLHGIREFKTAAATKRHIKIELCFRLRVMRLFQVGLAVQTRRSVFSLAWLEWLSCKGKERKIFCFGFTFSSEPQIWKLHVIVWQATSKNCTEKRAARAARLYFRIQPIKLLICGGVAVALVKS